MNKYILLLLIFGLILYFPQLSIGQKSYGLEFDEHQYKSVHSRPFLINKESSPLPAMASLKEYSPKPLSQRMENTSPGWAAAYGARTILEAQRLGYKSFDEIKRICFSPVFNYHLAKPDHAEDCSAPVKLPSVLETMKNYGTPRYIDFRKSCPNEISDDVYLKAYEYRIADYFRIFNEEDNMTSKMDAVKKSLANGSPVVAGMYVTPSFENVKDQFWQPREQLDPETHPGHSLVIVGYDDTKFTGAFEVMNSWGTEWGNEGFIWIRYKDFAEYVTYGFELFVLDPNNTSTGNLSGKVEIPLLDGTEMNFQLENARDGYYKTVNKFDDGTTFNLVINSLKKSFVYVFGSDQTEQIYDIYPDSWISPAMPYPDNNLVIAGIGLDDTPGSSYLCILFSRQEMSKTLLYDKLNEYKGKEFSDKVHIAFYSRLVPPENLTFEDNEIEFSGLSENKDLVAIIVEILHD